MSLILPIVSFLLFLAAGGRKGMEWREAVLAASVLLGTCVAAITEGLSLVKRVTPGSVAICWLAICIFGLLYLKSGTYTPRPTPRETEPGQLGPNRPTKVLLAFAGVIVFFVAITALVSAPNMWDAMEYHLPRVLMWMSNHSVRFFPTPNYCQLIFGPWAEYAMMHTYLLWGTDRFVNLVNFFSFIGCLIGVSLIAKKLGAGRRGQILAVIVCATIPEGVLEASGPKNTFAVSFWIVATVAFLLIWNDDPSWVNTIFVGLSAGLALLTKGDAYIYLPFMVLACWWMGSPASRILFLKRSAVFLVLIFAINGPQFFRSYQLTGSPLGLPFPDAGPALHWMVDKISVRGAIANTIRNVSLHLVTPIPVVNGVTERSVRMLIRGVGADPDDPQTTWPGDTFHLNNFSTGEKHAGNPAHFALLLLSISAILLWRRRRGLRAEVMPYAFGLVASFLLFCTLLRWQIWGSRHHLPVFVLGAALAGLVLERCFSPKVATIVGAALLAYALPLTLVNRTRSLVPWSRVDDVYHPRAVLYFGDQHERDAPANIAAAQAINHRACSNVAIDSYVGIPASQIAASPRSYYVYPLLEMIGAGRTRRVWYTGVQNLSSRFASQENHPAPCAVACFDCANHREKWEQYRDVGGQASVFDYIVVFSSAEQVLKSHAGMGLAQSDAAADVPSRDPAR